MMMKAEMEEKAKDYFAQVRQITSRVRLNVSERNEKQSGSNISTW